MWTKRAGDLVAAFVVGNGVLDLLAPRQRVLLWAFGPEALRKLALWFADHPAAMRLRGAVRIGTGVWLALRQYREAPRPSSSWHQRWSSRYRLAEHRSAGLVLAPLGLVAAISLITVLYRRRGRSNAARDTGPSRSTVARVIELSATSEESFEDAIDQGVERATSTLRNVKSAWIKDMNVLIENNQIAAYKVNMAVTFVLEEGEQPG
jgi:flavin-binding protein dodecin